MSWAALSIVASMKSRIVSFCGIAGGVGEKFCDGCKEHVIKSLPEASAKQMTCKSNVCIWLSGQVVIEGPHLMKTKQLTYKSSLHAMLPPIAGPCSIAQELCYLSISWNDTLGRSIFHAEILKLLARCKSSAEAKELFFASKAERHGQQSEG